jgi:AcrR family transcriptional regulator
MRVDKDRICQQAIILANRGGLDDLSMNDLAQALNIRAPSLYSHVAGINDVKRLLALHGLDLLDRSIAQATIGKSGAAAVASALNAYRDFVKANPGVYAAMVPTPPRSDREWSGAVDRLMDTLLASLREYGLQGSELIHALRGLRSLVHGFVSLESSGALKHRVDRDESFAWMVGSFIAALERMSSQRRAKRSAGVRA